MEANNTENAGRECSQCKQTYGGSDSSTTETTEENLIGFYQTCRINIRYHAKRQRFFDNWHHITIASSAILGTSSFALVLGNYKIISSITTATIGILSALDLVFRFQTKAECHKNLKCNYLELLCKINLKNISYSDLENEMFLIERGEPPTLRGLLAVCHNQQCKAVGDEKSMFKIPLKVKLFKQFLSFDDWEPEYKI